MRREAADAPGHDRAMKRLFAAAVLLAVSCGLSCASTGADGGVPVRRGTLLLIGGGLDDDAELVYCRFLELASARGTPRIVVATAATGPQDEEATDKSEALAVWSPGVSIDILRRETSTAASVAMIDGATAMFFTGGDQKRITDRYRTEGRSTPEWEAMRRLLDRGGVIAGASAGDAMMGTFMILGGGSSRALGIPPDVPDGEPVVLGPQVGPGMDFLPFAVTDSHWFERDRMGRLVATLEATGVRLGIGVGEDAAVEVDLATGIVTGLTSAETLVVDATHVVRDGATRRNAVGRLLARGDRLETRRWAPAPPVTAASVDAAAPRKVPVVEPGQNRQLASWRLFRHAASASRGVWRLDLGSHAIEARPASDGDVAFDIVVPKRR